MHRARPAVFRRQHVESPHGMLPPGWPRRRTSGKRPQRIEPLSLLDSAGRADDGLNELADDHGLGFGVTCVEHHTTHNPLGISKYASQGLGLESIGQPVRVCEYQTVLSSVPCEVQDLRSEVSHGVLQVPLRQKPLLAEVNLVVKACIVDVAL